MSFDLIPYSPRRQLLRLRRMIDRLLDEPRFTSRWDPFSPSFFEPAEIFPSLRFDPFSETFPGDNLAVDLYEQDDRLVLKATLPDVKKEDIDVIEQDGILTIRARSEMEQDRQEYGWHVRERRSGYWQRSLRLPMEVDTHRAEAVLQNGVLTVTLPKREPHKKLFNRIKVNLPKIKRPALLKREEKVHISRN